MYSIVVLYWFSIPTHFLSLVPRIVVFSVEETNKRIFKFILLGSLSLGVNKIYAYEGEMNDTKIKPPLELPLLLLLISHEPVWNSLSVLPRYGP